ncbi:MAG: radical SAM/SPASM domain-containing protein [Acidobacteriota bacterium]
MERRDMPLLAKILNRAIESAHPYNASIELTYTCNLACRFCYNPVQRKNQARTAPPPEPKAPPLSFEEIVGVMDQLKEMNVLYLTLTGGEALLHPRFWDIAREAKARSFAIRVFTNGAGITEAVADRLAELGPYCIEMSLHGANPETAEALTQVKGSFDRQMKALGYLSARGLRVFLKVVVTRLVEKELKDLKAIGDRFGYPVYFDPVLTISDDGQQYPLDLTASDEALASLYRQDGINIGNSPFDREPGEYNCTVGTGMMHITPYGDVQPCTQWKQPVGNVRQAPLRQIWETSPLLMKIREINRAVPGHIRETVEEHAYCFSCPGLSQLRTGDPMRVDDQYLRIAKIRRAVAREGETTGGGCAKVVALRNETVIRP